MYHNFYFSLMGRHASFTHRVYDANTYETKNVEESGEIVGAFFDNGRITLVVLVRPIGATSSDAVLREVKSNSITQIQ